MARPSVPDASRFLRRVSLVYHGALMDPSEFLSLALRLSVNPREADLRSAVSRAYYGAFHIACGLVEDCGIRFSGKDLYGSDVHRKVRFCLRESGNRDLARAGEKLGSLREERNLADYDLKSRKFDPPTVALRLKIAREVVDAVDRCRRDSDFAAIRDPMRTYARDVLRLSVVDD